MLTTLKAVISSVFRFVGVVKIKVMVDQPENPYSWGGQ